MCWVNRNNKIIILCVLISSTHSIFCQSNPIKTTFSSSKRLVEITPNNEFTKKAIDSTEIHAPDGPKRNGGVNQLKKAITRAASKTNFEQKATSIPSPYILKSYQIYQQYVSIIDSLIPINGGTPLDNTLAISNEGLFMTAINSKIVAYDTNKDSSLYQFSSNNLTYSRAIASRISNLLFSNNKWNNPLVTPFTAAKTSKRALSLTSTFIVGL